MRPPLRFTEPDSDGVSIATRGLAASALAGLLGLPAGVLVMSGALLLVYVAAAVYLAAHEPVSRSGVGMLVAANWAWVGGCAVVFLMNAGSATPRGQAYMIIHAQAVAALAELEWFGLRHAPRVGWA